MASVRGTKPLYKRKKLQIFCEINIFLEILQCLSWDNETATKMYNIFWEHSYVYLKSCLKKKKTIFLKGLKPLVKYFIDGAMRMVTNIL